MTRQEAMVFTHEKLIEYGLSDWHARLTTDMTKGFLGLCSHGDKAIIISAHHIDIHDTEMVKNTILHEIAHALTPGHSHDPVWKAKASEVGCINTQACSNLAFTPEAIDAIRSGATLEVEIETQTIHTPKYKVTRLQDKCPECGKVAVVDKEFETREKKFIYLTCGHHYFRILPKQTAFDKWVSADADPDCIHEWNGPFCTNCAGKRPMPFQVAGMRALEKGLAIQKGFGLFDEMGLGKTMQTHGWIKFHREEASPVLYVVKSGILYQFFVQTHVWLGDDFIGQIIKTSQDPVLPKMPCYFISYDMLIPKTRKGKNGKIIKQGFDIQKFIDRGIKTLVLDECQLIKNPDSSRTQQVRRLAASVEHVIPLSGTPWKNRGSEFYAVLNMIAPTKFNSYQGFLNRWVDYQWHGNKYVEAGIRNIKEFKIYTQDILIRREYDEVMEDFPEVSRTLHYTDIDAVNQQMYDEEVSSFVKWWNEKIIGGEDTNQFGTDNIMAKLARMRHILGLAKIPATVDYVDEFVEDTEKKLVVFVHHKDVGHILYEKLKAAHGDMMPVLALTADLDSSARYNMQELFNKSPRAIMVASTLASGEGINLQTCSDAVLHERQWNPQNEDQAAPGRFKRVGQTAKHINVVCITGHDTVDDYLHAIIERKRKFFHAAMNKGEVASWNVTDIMQELGEAIVRGASGKSVKQYVKK
jgi:hypothetical protein